MITAAKLHIIAPAARNLEQWTDLLNKYMPKYEINTRNRVCIFIANLAHESGSFNYTKEIASGAAYEGRIDLGNTVPGDGVKFKGRGLIQITGRGMYLKCSNALYNDTRLLTKPELLEAPDAATESACWFWKAVKGLNAVADELPGVVHSYKGKQYDSFEWTVLRINGGQNGIAERKMFLQRALGVIN